MISTLTDPRHTRHTAEAAAAAALPPITHLNPTPTLVPFCPASIAQVNDRRLFLMLTFPNRGGKVAVHLQCVHFVNSAM